MVESRLAKSFLEAADHLPGLEESRTVYYNTMYRTLLAAVRPLDLAAAAGLPDSETPSVLDFGFASIGMKPLDFNYSKSTYNDSN